MIIVNGWKPLTIITKYSILDVAAALDPPLGKSKNFIILRLRPLLPPRSQKGHIRELDNIFSCHSAMARDIETFFSLHNGLGTFVLSQTIR